MSISHGSFLFLALFGQQNILVKERLKLEKYLEKYLKPSTLSIFPKHLY